MLRRALAQIVIALAVGTGIAVGAACGTDAVGVDACRAIESARCHRAPDCPDDISLAKPIHPGNDVNACVLFYNDACEHGLAVADPGAPQVDKCVKAINAGGCNIVLHPEQASACSWLIPPATPDASDEGEGGEAEAGDAAADATAD